MRIAVAGVGYVGRFRFLRWRGDTRLADFKERCDLVVYQPQ